MDSLAYQKQLYDLESKINQIKAPKAMFDLNTMSHTCRDLLTTLSREEVEVRRIRKETIKYTQLKNDLEEALKNLEHFITFAVLSNPK